MVVGKISPHKQKLVDEYFDASSTFWTEVYQRKDLFSLLIQQRQVVALSYVDELSLPKNTRVLEVGCGAGFMAVALARKGFTVEAIDSLPVMIELTQRHARQAGMDKRVHATIGDVHELAFQNQSFDLVVALGVTPWLHSLRKALVEIARVLTPCGHVVLSMDNQYLLTYLLDPLRNPAFGQIRKRVKRQLERAGLLSPRDAAHHHRYSIKEFNAYLCGANLLNIKNTDIGYGPFTLLEKNIFPDRIGVKIHQKLQQYADSGFPILRSTGTQYVVLARNVHSMLVSR